MLVAVVEFGHTRVWICLHSCRLITCVQTGWVQTCWLGSALCLVQMCASVTITGDPLSLQTGWMMWNWMVSVLAVGGAIVLYDGSPLVPHVNILWDIVDNVG